jgi:DNA-binding NtrC family response regulator
MISTDHNVLLVDDNKEFLTLLKEKLNDLNININCASSINEARGFFSKKYNVIAADFNLGGGVTGADIINMYKVKHPNTHAILYTRGTLDDDTSKFEVDKLFNNMDSNEISELVENIKLYSIDGIEPQIIETMFIEINKIKSRFITLQESVASVITLKQTMDELSIKVENFINNHKNDAYKIILAFATLEALRAIWEKFFK